MKTICGIDCSECGLKANCGGCKAANGHPSANRVRLPNAVKSNSLAHCDTSYSSECRLKTIN